MQDPALYERVIRHFASIERQRTKAPVRIEAAILLAPGILALRLGPDQYAVVFNSQAYQPTETILRSWTHDVVLPPAWQSFHQGRIPMPDQKPGTGFRSLRDEVVKRSLISATDKVINWLESPEPVPIPAELRALPALTSHAPLSTPRPSGPPALTVISGKPASPSGVADPTLPALDPNDALARLAVLDKEMPGMSLSLAPPGPNDQSSAEGHLPKADFG